jgi:hypothetical protein
LYEKRHPVSFSRKADLLKKWFTNHPPLAQFKDDMRVLTIKLKTVAEESRNPLMHCIFKSYEPSTQTLTIQNVRPKPDGNVYIIEFGVTLEQINRFTEHVNRANIFLGQISSELFTPIWLERLHTPE